MENVVYYVVGFSLTIIGMLGERCTGWGGKFRQIEERFRQVDERFRQIDERFSQIDERFRQMEERFKGMESRFGEVESGLKSYVDRSVDRVSPGSPVTRSSSSSSSRRRGSLGGTGRTS